MSTELCYRTHERARIGLTFAPLATVATGIDKSVVSTERSAGRFTKSVENVAVSEPYSSGSLVIIADGLAVFQSSTKTVAHSDTVTDIIEHRTFA